MGNLPGGTVTFLFTDIEGSTRLAQQYPDSIGGLLERHHAILKSAIEAHGGYIFHIIGDAFCAAFQTVREALEAAVEAQRCLATESWSPEPIRVRMGICSGSAQVKLRDDRPPDYAGYLNLARVQRVMSVAYGGQILLGNASAELARGELPANMSLRDMGEHRLKSLLNPERLWQVVAPGLQADFPPLKSLSAIPNNLPLQLTSFIGRERELAEVRELLEKHRLVTLTGAGGTGKSRLSLQVAAELLDQCCDGIWFIELASISEPGLVPQAILHGLELSEASGREPLTLLKDYLADKSLLLILDNCEHLLDAVCRCADAILGTAPQVKIMSTSREPLNLAGEQAYRVPPLSVPGVEHLPRIGQLAQYEAVHLFIERASLAAPKFTMTDADCPAIAQICCRLDGIPLAIELAAARVKSMPLDTIASHLNDRFRLLTGGSRTALPRQQTLRAMIDWSYALLSGPEKGALQRLSVFRGGRTLEAAEAVCSGEAIQHSDVLNLISKLVDKSLLSLDEHGRYRMLETVRQYAGEKLAEASQDELDAKDRHCVYFAAFLQNRQTGLTGSRQKSALSELVAEDENIQTAWDWAVEHGKVDEINRSLETWAEMHRIRGLYQRAESALGKAVVMLGKDTSAGADQRLALGKVLLWRARFCACLGHTREADSLYKESLILFRDLGARRDAAYAVAFAAGCGEPYGNANPDDSQCADALTQFRTIGDEAGIALALNGLAWATLHQGNYLLAKEYFKQSLSLFRKTDNREGIVQSLGALGYNSWILGECAEAMHLHEEMLRLCKETGDRGGIALCIGQLGIDAYGFQDAEKAQRLFQESLELHQAIGDQRGVADELGDLASASNALGAYHDAAQFAQRSLDVYRTVSPGGISWAWPLRELGKAACGLGALPEAREHIHEALALDVANKRRPWVMLDLVVVAQIMMAEGRSERALEVLALVVNHPISWQMARNEAAPLMASLEHSMPSAAVATAQARGRSRDLERTVQELLVQLRE